MAETASQRKGFVVLLSEPEACSQFEDHTEVESIADNTPLGAVPETGDAGGVILSNPVDPQEGEYQMQRLLCGGGKICARELSPGQIEQHASE